MYEASYSIKGLSDVLETDTMLTKTKALPGLRSGACQYKRYKILKRAFTLYSVSASDRMLQQKPGNNGRRWTTRKPRYVGDNGDRCSATEYSKAVTCFPRAHLLSRHAALMIRIGVSIVYD